jgi:hypothetical protein
MMDRELAAMVTFGVWGGQEFMTLDRGEQGLEVGLFVRPRSCLFDDQDLVDQLELGESVGGMVWGDTECDENNIVIGRWLMFADCFPSGVKAFVEIETAVLAIEVSQIRFDEQVAFVAKRKMESNHNDWLTDERISQRRGLN